MTETCDFASGRSQSRFAALANAGELAAEPMREHDRRRHQFRRLVAGKTEHQTLIARALFGVSFAFRLACIDALRDVRALARDDVLNDNLVGMKHIVVVHVTDLAHGIAHDLVDGTTDSSGLSFGRFGIVISPPTMTMLLLA